MAESRALGADAILVILAMVDDALAADLMAEAARLGMDALVETHDEAEMARAGGARRRPDRGQQPRPAHLRHRPRRHRAPGRRCAAASALLVTESGIFTAADAARLAARRRQGHAGRRKPDAPGRRRRGDPGPAGR